MCSNFKRPFMRIAGVATVRPVRKARKPPIENARTAMARRLKDV